MTDDFLQQHHAAYDTPEDVLRTLIADTTGRTARSFEPIVHGYANEVYRAQTSDSDEIIIRIQQHGVAGFEHEAWAMSRCREVGVPVPEVYGVTRIETDDGPREAMVMQQAAGHVLSEIIGRLREDDCAHVFANVGRALQAMHRIRVERFGWLSAESYAGDRSDRTWNDHAARLIEERRSDLPFLIEAGLAETEAGDLLAIVKRMVEFACPAPLLCHGDLSTDHLYVDDELNITGIIDFGMCQGGPGVLDVAVLLMFHPEVELQWLAQGYGEELIRDEDIQRQIVAH